ncbi:hypothetical protein Tco_0162025 [Tanacetum coccineum]|uniref:Transposase n=1 Tax=Tanacetum coccineum TaxID=301880 RepID=A0ABQ5BWN3_9ASTR
MPSAGPWPGQILTAVGVDANNGIYPVAYAIVEAESKALLVWVLNLLEEDPWYRSCNTTPKLGTRKVNMGCSSK